MITGARKGKDSGRERWSTRRAEEQDGGISMLRNTFFQTRGMRGEFENEVGHMKAAGYNWKRKSREDARMPVHTVYSQTNEKMIGRGMTTRVKKQKSKVTEGESHSLQKSPVSRDAVVLGFFFFFFPRFCQFLTGRPSFLSLSPTGPPLFPLPFFLPVPVLFSPTSLLLCLSCLLLHTMLSIFPSIFSSVPFICPFSGHSFSFWSPRLLENTATICLKTWDRSWNRRRKQWRT